MDFMDLPIGEWKAFDTLYALDSFGSYWVENERLIAKAAEAEETQNRPKWEPRSRDELEEYRAELDAARHLHDKIVLPTFRYSCVVMLFVIVERELLRLARNLESEHKGSIPPFVTKPGSLLKPVFDYCKKHFNLDFSACHEYQALCDLQKIRDCIVHCHGEVSLSKDAEYLIKLEQQKPGFSACKGLPLEIESECIKVFVNQVWKFFLWVFLQRKWNVSDEWLKRNWE